SRYQRGAPQDDQAASRRSQSPGVDLAGCPMTDMPRKPIRLIVTDLDGTLLNSAHEVSPRTEAAIRAAQAQGVAFTVATGKTFPSTTALIERFDIQLPVICGNGTSVHDIDGTVLYEDPIPPDLAVEAVHFAA